jgi:hypothetical protein
MGIGESISKGFGTANKSMGLVLVLFVFGFIFNLLNVFLAPPPGADAAAEAPPSPALLVAGVVFILLTIFFQGGSMAYIRDRIKSGSATLANFTSGGARYYLKLFLLGLVVSLVIGVFVLLAALAASFLQGIPALGAVLAIVCAALGVYFVVMLFLSPYAAVADEQSVGGAIKLSMKLVKRNILALLGISILMILIGFGIGLVLGAVLAGVSFVVKAETASSVVFALLSSLVNAYLGVVVTATFMNFYLSLSDRNNA